MASLQKSVEELLAQLAVRDSQLQVLKDENASFRREATHLRSELNKQYSERAGKMMDVAMEASTQAMEQDAERIRRRDLESRLLCKELRDVERSSARARSTTNEPSVGASWFPR